MGLQVRGYVVQNAINPLVARIGAAGPRGIPLDKFSDAELKLLAKIHAKGEIVLTSGPCNEPLVRLAND